MRDRVCRPATAYHIVAALLDDEYFLTPPPRTGLRVTVASRTDQAVSEWYIDNQRAEQLLRTLQPRRDLIVTANAYEIREPA